MKKYINKNILLNTLIILIYLIILELKFKIVNYNS